MPVELFYKPNFGRRLRKISNAAASALEKIAGPLYTSIAPPELNTSPTIAGTTTVGSTLTVTPGTYDFSPTLTYQWYVDDVAAGGETGLTFDTTGLEADDEVHCKETAINMQGTLVTDSNTITLT